MKTRQDKETALNLLVNIIAKENFVNHAYKIIGETFTTQHLDTLARYAVIEFAEGETTKEQKIRRIYNELSKSKLVSDASAERQMSKARRDRHRRQRQNARFSFVK